MSIRYHSTMGRGRRGERAGIDTLGPVTVGTRASIPSVRARLLADLAPWLGLPEQTLRARLLAAHRRQLPQTAPIDLLAALDLQEAHPDVQLTVAVDEVASTGWTVPDTARMLPGTERYDARDLRPPRPHAQAPGARRAATAWITARGGRVVSPSADADVRLQLLASSRTAAFCAVVDDDAEGACAGRLYAVREHALDELAAAQALWHEAGHGALGHDEETPAAESEAEAFAVWKLVEGGYRPRLGDLAWLLRFQARSERRAVEECLAEALDAAETVVGSAEHHPTGR